MKESRIATGIHNPMETTRIAACFAALFVIGSHIAGARAQTPQDRYTKHEVMIPMRDGIRLYTAVYVPKNRPGKHPILLERSGSGAGPSGPERYRKHRGSPKFDENGYIFVDQDVRGASRSEGVFVQDRPQLINPLKPHDIDESTDTYDTIDYLIKYVPGNNGRVGLWGISNRGFYAAVGAIHSHRALRAVSPQAPASDWFLGDDFHHNGALFLMDAALTGDKDPDTGGDAYRFYLEHGTLSALTKAYFKETDTLWNDLMEHSTYDEYWQARNLPHNMHDVHCAMMTVGGWFDAEDLWGALHTARATAAQNISIPSMLVMGPWDHGMWAGQTGNRLGDQDFGQLTSAFFQNEIEFPFFDAFLRGNGNLRLPAARVFETGANRWRTFRQWPPREAKQTNFYLLPGKTIGITPPTDADVYDEYVSDPTSPVPYQGGVIRKRTAEYMIDDQRFAANRKDVLTYQTAPLASDLTLAGPITADLYVSVTATDADFVVKIVDGFPDDARGKLAGYQMLVRAEVLRAKFRNSYSNPAPLTPLKTEHAAYEMPDIFHTFRKGHRLMVQIQSSWFPLVDRNPQQFMDIYKAKPEDFQMATIHIHRGALAASHLRVGVLSPE